MTARTIAAAALTAASPAFGALLAAALTRASSMPLAISMLVAALTGVFGVIGIVAWRGLCDGLAPVIDARQRARSDQERWKLLHRLDPAIALAYLARPPGPPDQITASPSTTLPPDPNTPPQTPAGLPP